MATKVRRYQFEIEYLKGKQNKVADFLSRIEHNEDVNFEKEGSVIHTDLPNIENFTLKESDSQLELFNIEEDTTGATIHSAEEDLLDHIPIKEDIVNKYKTKLILTNNKNKEIETIFGRRIIYIAEYEFNNLEDILKRFIKKGKTGIYSEISDSKYNIVKKKNKKFIFK